MRPAAATNSECRNLKSETKLKFKCLQRQQQGRHDCRMTWTNYLGFWSSWFSVSFGLRTADLKHPSSCFALSVDFTLSLRELPALLLSMTGHGSANGEANGLAVSAEVRTVNGRYLKMSLRCSDGYSGLESRAEEVVRRFVRRGTVQVDLRLRRELSTDDYRLNEVVLAGYLQQIQAIGERLQRPEPVRLEALMALPGVVDESSGRTADLEVDWPLIERTLAQALEQLSRMRSEEGSTMAVDLEQNRAAILKQVEQIELRAPQVVDAYRDRLTERIKKLLAEFEINVDAADLIREVGLFAERSDISEETVRLRSHLEQFGNIMHLDESSGRKLEFVTQEMSRETNTIGSKANDAQIAQRVIEIKASAERIREMIQNVE